MLECPRLAQLALLSVWCVGCGSGDGACAAMGAESSLAQSAAALRVDVFDSQISCDAITANSLPAMTHVFWPKQPLTMQVLPGRHAVVLTTYLDSSLTMVSGRGCRDVDLTPGSSDCLALWLTSFVDGGADDLASGADDLASGARDAAGVGFCSSGPASSACPNAQYLFCDDFESETGSAFTPLWDGSYTNGAADRVDVVGSPVCRGNHALEVYCAKGNQRAGVLKTITLPSTAYLRAWVFVPTSTDWATLAYANLISFDASGNGDSIALRFGPNSGEILLDRSWVAGSLPPLVHPFAPGAWRCVELGVSFDATAGTASIWIDGQQQTLGPLSTTRSGDQMNQFHVVIDTTPGGATGIAQVFFDEVALSASHIGCN